MFETGIVRVKSVYPFNETINRIKQDVAAKGLMFFIVDRFLLVPSTSPGSPLGPSCDRRESFRGCTSQGRISPAYGSFLRLHPSYDQVTEQMLT